MPHERYVVMGFEKNRYEGGFRVFDNKLGFEKGRVSDVSGDSDTSRAFAQSIAAELNRQPYPLRRFLCCVGFHHKIEIGDPEYFAWAGREKCTDCGKEFPWSNSM